MNAADGFLCNRCGYNLSGLSPDGRCPECGVSVARSQAGDSLSAADGTWLGHIARGQYRIVSAAILVIVVHGVFVVSAEYIRSWLTPTAFDLALPLARIAAQVWLLIGVLGLTRQDPRLTLVEASLNLRFFVRAGAGLALCLAPVSGGVLNSSLGSALPLQPLRVAYSAFVLLTIAGVTVYMSRLALRIPEKRLANASKNVGIGLGVTAIVYLLGRSLLNGGSIVQAFDRSVVEGVIVLLTNVFGFGLLCYLSRALYLWLSYRRILSQFASRAWDTVQQVVGPVVSSE